MRLIKFYFIILFTLFLGLLLNCSNSDVSGGGSEAGNGAIVGSIKIIGSDYKKDCQISIYPESFSPFKNDTGKRVTTSNSNGHFQINKLTKGKYTIYVHSADSLNASISTFELFTDNDTISSDLTLKAVSVIRVALNQNVSDALYYIEGTDIIRNIETDSQNIFTINRVPSDTINIRLYPDTLNLSLNIPESFHTIPGDTLEIIDNFYWKHIDEHNSPLPHSYVYSLYLDSNIEYWGTYYGLLEINNSDTIIYDKFNTDLEDSWIKKIRRLSDSTLLICQLTGAASFKNDQWGYIIPTNYGSTGSEIFDALEINDTTLLLGTHGGVLKLTPNDTILDNTYIPSTSAAFTFTKGKNNTFFIGTRGNGVYIIGDNIKDSINSSNSTIQSDVIQTLYNDSKDNLWIGTFGGGVYKYSNNVLEKISGNFTDSIYTITETSYENVWIGTSTGELVRYDGLNVDVFNSSNSPLPESAILALSVDRFNRLYVGTYGKGLYTLEEN